MAELDVTNIPPPRVPVIDERTGLISREWYRFFVSLFNLTGAGSNPVSLSDIQKGPPPLTVDDLGNPPDPNVGPPLQDVSAQINAAVQDLVVGPQPQESNTLNTNYLDFELDAPRTPQIGRVGWTQEDQTLEIGMDYGVNQQVGMETYARVENATGVTIPNGTVVGFAGVSANNVLSVVPYVADGTVPTLYILGVMTHDLPNSGEVGYCTVWGHVRDVDTSAFSVGDILYADPATPGGFTNVKPTAPDAVVPVAAVLESDATNGEIFVRPTIEQQQYYGVFSDTTDQSPSAAYTPKAVSFNTTDVANGFSVVGTPASRITAAVSGLYSFKFSLQITSGSASAKTLWIWPRVNGVDVPNSNGKVTISGSGTVLVPSWSWTLSLDASDYFELIYAADDTNIELTHEAAATGAVGGVTFARPAIPSVILEVNQIQQ